MFLWLLLTCSRAPEAPPRPPDIVLVVVDTLRADHVGVYGHVRATTPAIDALANEGYWFRRAYAQSGWTLPSITSLLTGLYPHVHRVGRAPFDADTFGRLEADRTTLAEALKSVGYGTAAFVNNTFMAPEFGLHQGFDVYDYQGATNDHHRSASETVDLARAWMATQAGPMLLLVHLMEPHLDYAPPSATRGTFTGDGPPLVPIPFGSAGQIELKDDRGIPTPPVVDYVRRLYDEEILATDQALGGLFDAVRTRGNWDNTLVVVTADHGEEFWEHGGFEHGHSLLGTLTQVPLVFGGGLARHRAAQSGVVQHVDVFQTLLRMGRADSPPESVGVDLRADLLESQLALSENTLYGPPRLSIVDEHYRLELNLEEMAGAVYQVRSGGKEVRVSGAAQQEHGARLEAAIRAVRGGLMPVDAVAGPKVPSVDAFRQLKALGYIDEGPDPKAPSGLPESATESPAAPH